MGDPRNRRGPDLFDSKQAAFEAMQKMTADLGWPFGRIRVRLYEYDAVRMRDEVSHVEDR